MPCGLIVSSQGWLPAQHGVPVRERPVFPGQVSKHMSQSLNSLNRGHIREHVGDYIGYNPYSPVSTALGRRPRNFPKIGGAISGKPKKPREGLGFG